MDSDIESKKIKLEHNDIGSMPSIVENLISDDEQEAQPSWHSIKSEILFPEEVKIEISSDEEMKNTDFDKYRKDLNEMNSESLDSIYEISDDDSNEDDLDKERIGTNLSNNFDTPPGGIWIKPLESLHGETHLNSNSIEPTTSGIENHYLLGLIEMQERNILEECSIPPYQHDSGYDSSCKWYDQNPGQLQIPFTGKPCLKLLRLPESPIDFFRLIVNKELVNLLVNKTNLNAKRLLQKEQFARDRNKTMRQWTKLTVNELSKFLGILYFSGHIVSPNISMLWKESNLYDFSKVSSAMDMERFLLILRVLSYGKPAENYGYKAQLSRMKPLLDIFEKNMSSTYYPRRELCLYETIVSWNERLSFRQYMPSEPSQCGIKLYMLAQPDGLVLKLHLYIGGVDPDVSGENYTDKVVTKLLNDFIGKGHALYMNSLYSSVPLTKYLLDNKTYVTGALRKNRRGNPEQVCGREVDLKRNQVIATYSEEGICVFRWKDKRDTTIISSEHDASILHTVSSQGKTILRPNGLIQYDTYMSGLENSDQFFLNCPLPNMSLPCHTKLAVLIFHIMMNNAYLLYNSVMKNRQIELNDFRESVILDLLKENLLADNLQDQENLSTLDKQTHLPRKVSSYKRKRCKLCFANGTRRDSIYVCDTCKGNPGFCLEPCFRLYHEYI